MAEEKEEVQPQESEKPKKAKNNLLVIILIAVFGLIALGGGGFFGYKMLTDAESGHEEETITDAVILPFDPFILNLADRGRYLKLSVQVELADEKHVEAVEVRTPQLRDAIIMLISDKSSQSIATSEGKFQLKDEILFRVNRVLGVDKDIVNNIYFTEFVMQ